MQRQQRLQRHPQRTEAEVPEEKEKKDEEEDVLHWERHRHNMALNK